MTFTRIDDFSMQSARPGRCYVLNIPKPPEDRGVFRGPMIHMEGFLDVSERAIREAAHSLGMIDESKAEAMRAEIEQLRRDLAATAEQRDHFKQQAREMILQNAELVSELDWLSEQADEDDGIQSAAG